MTLVFEIYPFFRFFVKSGVFIDDQFSCDLLVNYVTDQALSPNVHQAIPFKEGPHMLAVRALVFEVRGENPTDLSGSDAFLGFSRPLMTQISETATLNGTKFSQAKAPSSGNILHFIFEYVSFWCGVTAPREQKVTKIEKIAISRKPESFQTNGQRIRTPRPRSTAI